MADLLKELNSIGAETDDALARFMLDKQMYEKYIKKFPSEKTMDELVKAVDCKDYIQAEKSVHALKGIVSNLGFIPLFDASLDMLVELRDNNIPDALEAYEDIKKQYKIYCDVIEKYNK